jgi:hypothetical protein
LARELELWELEVAGSGVRGGVELGEELELGARKLEKDLGELGAEELKNGAGWRGSWRSRDLVFVEELSLGRSWILDSC